MQKNNTQDSDVDRSTNWARQRLTSLSRREAVPEVCLLCRAEDTEYFLLGSEKNLGDGQTGLATLPSL